MFKKQLTAVNILLSITIAISLFNEGSALKCYQCAGKKVKDDRCWSNLKEDNLEKCGAEGLNTPETSEWECVKTVHTSIDHLPHVSRFCAPKSKKMCDEFRQNHLGQWDASCDTCTKDGCNSSSTLTLGLVTFLLPMIIVMLLTH